jgi:hypothetical protein
MSRNEINSLRFTVHRSTDANEKNKALKKLLEHPELKKEDLFFIFDVVSFKNELLPQIEEKILELEGLSCDILIKLTLYGVGEGVKEKAFERLIKHKKLSLLNLRLVAMSATSPEMCMQAANKMLRRRDLTEEDLKAVSGRAHCDKVRRAVLQFYDLYILKRRRATLAKK